MQLSSLIVPAFGLALALAAAGGAEAQPILPEDLRPKPGPVVVRPKPGPVVVRPKPDPVEIPPTLPPAPERMALYQLEPVDPAEVARQVDALLQDADPQRPLKLNTQLDNQTVAALDETGTVRAWVDQTNGDAAIYPRLSAADSGELDERELLDKAQAWLYALFGDGDEQPIAGPTRALQHTRIYSDNTASNDPPAKQLLYVAAQRQLPSLAAQGPQSLRVEGPGSRAVLALDAQGRVQALARRWRRAKLREVVPARPVDVWKQIERQLEPARQNASVSVLYVTLVYYDGGERLIQPAYRFVAELEPREHSGKSFEEASSYLFGYVPYAAPLEPIPPAAASGSVPNVAPERVQELKPAPLISVGRYITRNAAADFAQDADDFWNALASSPSASALHAGDHLYSEPRLFTSESASYLHRMQIALIEGHGFPGGFATDGVLDPVNIAEIPRAPEGVSALSHWVLHSCSVIMTPDESSQWADPWWTALSGEASAVGYHTPMYINDGAGAAYGRSLGLGAPPLSAWLHDVTALGAYGDNPHGCQTHKLVPFGQPAVIATCDASDVSLARVPDGMVVQHEPAKCLDLWWTSDSVARTAAPLSITPTAADLCEDGGARATVTTATYIPECNEYECDVSVGMCGADCVDGVCQEWTGC